MPVDDARRPSDLRARLIATILRDGPIPVDRFMVACLSDPNEGYWQRPATIGARGDFITAPEISQVFGELIGLWCAVTWGLMGTPAPMRLIELGPGKGTLMADMQRTLAKAAPRLHAATQVHFVETSTPMREAQASAVAQLSAFPPIWHAALAEVDDGPSFVIANEFIDALPIRQFVFDGQAWRERLVGCTGAGELAFTLGPVRTDFQIGPARAGDVLELRPAQDDVLAQLAARTGPTMALFIDYGPAAHAFGDTLQAMRHHAYADVLAAPGTCDLTAHVQFASLAQTARSLGLAVDGPMTQAEFLGGLGLAVRTSRLMAANPRDAAAIELAAQRLVAPSGMGTLFKVLCVRTQGLPVPPPFG